MSCFYHSYDNIQQKIISSLEVLYLVAVWVITLKLRCVTQLSQSFT